ncbi:MAG: hypothetical protein AB2693_12670, partial [Candidatus Thiodiazotropha sp.]
SALLAVEGMAKDVPAGQKQMRIHYVNKQTFSTINKYRQFKIEFPDCTGWDALQAKIQDRDCLRSVGFDDKVEFPIIHRIQVTRKSAPSQSVFPVSGGSMEIRPVRRAAMFFTEGDDLKVKVDDMSKTDFGAPGRIAVDSTLAEQIALVNDCFKYYEYILNLIVGHPVRTLRRRWLIKFITLQLETHMAPLRGSLISSQKNGYKLLQPHLYMYYIESQGQPDFGMFTSEYVVQMDYSIGTVKVEEMWVRQFQAHAEKYKPQQLQWSYRDGANELMLVNMGMISESKEITPSGDTM